jgi:hypothetical protein
VESDYFAPAPAREPAWQRAPACPPSARRRSGAARLVGLVVVLAAALSVALTTTPDGVRAVPELRQVTAPAPASAGWSPAWVDDLGRPARWDACAPVRYVVNPAWMPDKGRADVAEAFRRIAAVSGLRFVDDGDTDEVPARDRAAYQPERYGDRWAPLLVAWVPPAATDLGLGNGIQGLAVTIAVPGEHGGSIVTGQVALDAERRLASGFGPGATEGEVLLHELTHAVGLGHVDDPTQVMYVRTTNSESEFGAGDRAGLSAIGAQAGCLPAPQAEPLTLS